MPRLPPSLKWLIDRRGRVAGELKKIERQLAKCQQAIDTYKQLDSDLAVLKQLLESVDRTLVLQQVADTAGAGDWCTAGMLAALFEAGLESSWQLTYNVAYRALRYGQSLAALNCMHIGARGVTQRWSARHVKHLAMELLEKSRTSIHPIHQQSKKPSKKRKASRLLCCESLEI